MYLSITWQTPEGVRFQNFENAVGILLANDHCAKVIDDNGKWHEFPVGAHFWTGIEKAADAATPNGPNH